MFCFAALYAAASHSTEIYSAIGDQQQKSGPAATVARQQQVCLAVEKQICVRNNTHVGPTLLIDVTGAVFL